MQIYKQIAYCDCFLACIATLVQKPIEELFDAETRQQTEDAGGTFEGNVTRAFEIAGLNENTDYWKVLIQEGSYQLTRDILTGRRAILQVPSLNHTGKWHLVYWTGETIYDPSNEQRYRYIEQCFPVYVWIFDERGLKLRQE